MAVVKKGAKGSTVKKIQVSLNTHGAKPRLEVDADFGPKTDTAVRKFQRDSKLKVDGIVGKQTSAALGYKPTPKGGSGILLPVWDLGDHTRAVEKTYSAAGIYVKKHEKLTAFMEKYIKSRVAKVATSSESEPDAKAAAEIFTKRYFELKAAYENIAAHYSELVYTLETIQYLQKKHQSAVKKGKVLEAEATLQEAEKLVPKSSKLFGGTSKAMNVYDKHFKRMEQCRVMFEVMSKRPSS